MRQGRDASKWSALEPTSPQRQGAWFVIWVWPLRTNIFPYHNWNFQVPFWVEDGIGAGLSTIFKFESMEGQALAGLTLAQKCGLPHRILPSKLQISNCFVVERFDWCPRSMPNRAAFYGVCCAGRGPRAFGVKTPGRGNLPIHKHIVLGLRLKQMNASISCRLECFTA